MRGSIPPVTIPPGHTPRDFTFFSYLAAYSPPPGTKKETISRPETLIYPNYVCMCTKKGAILVAVQ